MARVVAEFVFTFEEISTFKRFSHRFPGEKILPRFAEMFRFIMIPKQTCNYLSRSTRFQTYRYSQ